MKDWSSLLLLPSCSISNRLHDEWRLIICLRTVYSLQTLKGQWPDLTPRPPVILQQTPDTDTSFFPSASFPPLLYYLLSASPLPLPLLRTSLIYSSSIFCSSPLKTLPARRSPTLLPSASVCSSHSRFV